MKNLNNNRLRQLEHEHNELQFEYYQLAKRYKSLYKGFLILSLISTGVFITIINLI